VQHGINVAARIDEMVEVAAGASGPWTDSSFILSVRGSAVKPQFH